jgi:solute carrier family 35 protein F1/2
MSAQIQPEPHPGAAGFYGTKDHHDDGMHVDKTGAGIQVTNSGNGTTGAPNETLETVAESKGRWFQYVKTKQFWITLLLGQGTHISHPNEA